MSCKTTILLSNDNEHWYHDCSDDSFVIEFNKNHFDGEVANVDGGALVIEKGTALHSELRKVSGCESLMPENACKEMRRDNYLMKKFISKIVEIRKAGEDLNEWFDDVEIKSETMTACFKGGDC